MKILNFRDFLIFIKRRMLQKRFYHHKIRNIHVELTDKCNAACPMCARNINGGPNNPNLKNTEITLEIFKKTFSVEFIKQLRRVYFCGNYGDPAVGKDLIAIMEYLRDISPEIYLGMNSNAGIGSPERWKRLGEILSQKNDYCCFSIDGMADTNHIYRRNVKWNHVMQSAEAFIKAGGKARWEYIVFKHNEHQTEDARKLAISMGFSKFNLKDTGRFFSIQNDVKVQAYPVYDKNLEFEYYIEPSTLDTERYQTSGIFKDLVNSEHNSFFPKKMEIDINSTGLKGLDENYFTESNAENRLTTDANINCKAMMESSIFLSADGHIYPCCWTAYPMNSFWNSNEARQLRQEIGDCGGMDTINIHKTSIYDIIEGSFFKKIAQSWNKPCAKDGKLISCSIHCGTHLEAERRLTPKTANRPTVI